MGESIPRQPTEVKDAFSRQLFWRGGVLAALVSGILDDRFFLFV